VGDQGADPTEWMRELADDPSREGYTGFDLELWDAHIWVLHAMYESDNELTGGVTADELRKQAIESGQLAPQTVGSVNLDEEAVVTGVPLGRSSAPGRGWHRLHWGDLAAAIDAPLGSSGVPPCFRWFPYASWPARIRPPTEGSLDRESFMRLVTLLESTSTPDTQITCFYGPLSTRAQDFDTPLVITRRLADLPSLYDWEEVHGSPSNIWPQDRSWFIYTDWDLWGTRVSGTAEFVGSVAADRQLETISYP
jgi:hypothetical protein